MAIHNCTFLNIDKPAGLTSHDVVAKLRRLFGIKRIGHAGTLDPAATGVLPIAIGTASRLIPYLSNGKVYLAEIQLGIRTTTDDLCGTIIKRNDVPQFDQGKIREVLDNFTGELRQKPPLYSAIHKNGQRLYHWTRQQLSKNSEHDNQISILDDMLKEVKERTVTINKIELLQHDLPVLQVRINCSAGTYIRSLARDIGHQLGCGGCLKSLRREQSGIFTIDKAMSLPAIEQSIQTGELHKILIPPSLALDTPVIKLDLSQAIAIAKGCSLSWENLSDQNCLAVYLENSESESLRPIAMCITSADKLLKPKVVLLRPEDLNSITI